MKKQIFTLMFGTLFLSAGHVVAMDEEIKFSDNFTVGRQVQMLESTTKWSRHITKNFSLNKGQTLSFKHQLDIKEGSVYWGLSKNTGEIIKISDFYGAPQYTGRKTRDVYIVEYPVEKNMNDVRLGLHSEITGHPNCIVLKFEAKIKKPNEELKKKK